MSIGGRGIIDLFMLFLLILFLENLFFPLNAKLNLYQQSLESIGGGYPIPENNKFYHRELVRRINEHGLQNYHWKYKEILYPVYDYTNSYIRSEKGIRLNNNRYEYHNGIDIVSKYDFRLIASHDGTTDIGENNIFGKWLTIDNGKLKTRYCHISVFDVTGDIRVKQGDIIAIIGNTGKSQGPHLHFELYVDNVNVNPVANSTWKKEVIE